MVLRRFGLRIHTFLFESVIAAQLPCGEAEHLSGSACSTSSSEKRWMTPKPLESEVPPLSSSVKPSCLNPKTVRLFGTYEPRSIRASTHSVRWVNCVYFKVYRAPRP